MNASNSRSAIAARSLSRCFLHFLLCLVALGNWSTPAPAPLATAGDFGLLEHFLSDQAAAVSQQESTRLQPRGAQAETDDDADAPVLAAQLPATRRRPGPDPVPVEPGFSSNTTRAHQPQLPRAPPDRP